jgi:hypothetical protein
VGERVDRGLHGDILAIPHIRFSAYEFLVQGGVMNLTQQVARGGRA